MDKPQCEIRIGCIPEGEHWRFRVSDNGPGIDADALNKIFIPFYTTKKKGSGIGLSLSQQIIQSHGGQLRVNSSGGGGTTFHIVLGVV